jgi:hypothetical protein
VKSIFWDGDSIKTEKIGFQNAIKEVVEKIRIARELANLLAPFTLWIQGCVEPRPASR